MAKKDSVLEAGWSVMEAGVAKLQKILEEVPDEPPFDPVQRMQLYTYVFLL